MAPTPQVVFRWPESLVEAIDTARGDVPRSRYVQRVVEQHLEWRANAHEIKEAIHEQAGEMRADIKAQLDGLRTEPIPGQMTVDDVLDKPSDRDFHDGPIAEVDPVLEEPPSAWLGEPSDATTPEDVIEGRRAGTVRICPQCGDGAVGSDWICVECGYKLAPHER